MKVLVTGAAGAIGSAVVLELAHEGREVRAWAHSLPQDPELLSLKGVEWVTGDLNHTDLTKITLGVTHVVHAAALTDLSARPEKLHQVNVEGTRRLWKALEKQVDRWVHVSSASVYDLSRGSLFEEAEIRPETAYELSKWESENVFPQADRRVVILRPGLVYGPRMKNMAGKLFAILSSWAHRAGSLPRIQLDRATNWVHTQDVARAVNLVLFHPQAAGTTFNVGGPESIQLDQVLDVAARCLGVPRSNRTLSLNWLPMGALYQIVQHVPFVTRLISIPLEESWGQLQQDHALRSQLTADFDPDFLHYARYGFELNTTRLKSLGFQYRHPHFSQALEAVFESYQKDHWAPARLSVPLNDLRPAWGFQFDETMTGHWERPADSSANAVQSFFQFQVSSHAPDLQEFLRTGKMTSRGWLRADGLTAPTPCEGTLTMPVRSRFVHIELEFQADDGLKYRYVAMKKLTLFHLVRDITTFLGTLYGPDQHVVGTSVACFDLRNDVPKLIQSLGFRRPPVRRPNPPPKVQVE